MRKGMNFWSMVFILFLCLKNRFVQICKMEYAVSSIGAYRLYDLCGPIFIVWSNSSGFGITGLL